MFTALSLRKQAQFCESRARTCKPRFGGGPRPAHLGLKRCTVRQEGTYRGRGDESYTFRGDCSHARRSRPSLASWLETGGVEDVSLGVGDFARALTNSERRDQRRRDREFRGIVRPSPAPVLLLPTVRNCFSTSACAQVGLLISASRLPAFRAMVSAA